MPPLTSDLARLGVAMGLFGVALLAREVVEFFAPGRLPFITFFPAVLLSAFLSGLWPSLLVLTVSAVTGAWTMRAEPDVRVFGGISFALIGFIDVYLISYVVRARERERQRDRQLTLINQELKHRLKNLFAITSSLCRQSIQPGLTPEEMTQSIRARLNALAAAQDAMSIDATAGADLATLATSIVSPMSPATHRLHLRGPPARLQAETVTHTALILNELATNALKHGAWSSERGRVSIVWLVKPGDAADDLLLTWTEHDGPSVAAPEKEGLGSRLIKDGLRQGTVEIEYAPKGLVCRIGMPLSTTFRA
jgi:two-component sensor histidine kinase